MLSVFEKWPLYFKDELRAAIIDKVSDCLFFFFTVSLDKYITSPPGFMQSQPTPNFTYDALGRLVMVTPSGGSNDVAALVDSTTVEVQNPAQAITATGLVRPTVLNAPHLYTPAVSIDNPPMALITSESQASPGTIISTARPFLRP